MKGKKRAKKYAHEIAAYFSEANQEITLDFVHRIGELFIYNVELGPKTRERNIWSLLSDAQMSLKLELFQLQKNGLNLTLIIAENSSFDNRLLGILQSPKYSEVIKDMRIPFPIGFDAIRTPVVIDMVDYYSWLWGGAGGVGKTTGLQSLITSIAWCCSPCDVNVVVVDILANLTQFNGFPHLSCPVLCKEDDGIMAIIRLNEEMERRRNIKIENPADLKSLPSIVCIIDECVSFIAGAGGDKENLANSISNLLRQGRHTKIYLVLATQNSTVDDMKCDLNSITSRVAFKCAKVHDSTTFLGNGGAEHLIGNGEMYFKSQRHSGLQYIKGAYIDENEIERVRDYVCAKYENTGWENCKFIVDLHAINNGYDNMPTVSAAMFSEQDAENKLLSKIIMWALQSETISGNTINKTFKTGERKAGKILERLNKLGIVGEAQAKLGRKVLPSCIDDLTPETVSFVNKYGYMNEDIQTAFNTKNPHQAVNEVADTTLDQFAKS